MPTEVEDFYGDPRRTSAYPTRAQLNEAIDALRDGIASAEQLQTEFAAYVSQKETELSGIVSEAQTSLNQVVSEATTNLNGIISTAQTTLNTLISDTEADFDETLKAAAQIVSDLTNLRTEFNAIKQQVDAVVEQITQSASAAANSATAAGQSAEAASGSATAAGQSAEAAGQSAEAADKSAEAADKSAEAAAQSYADTEGIKTELQASVDDIALAMRRSVFDATAVSAETIILNPNVGYYTKSLTESEYTFVFDSTSFVVADGEIAKVNLLLDIGNVTPTVAFPANVYFGDRPPVFRPKTKMLIELTSANQGGFWIGRMAWTTSNYAYEVEYLTHSGGQYIDLGIEPDSDFVVRFKSQITTTAQGRMGVFGRYIGSGGKMCFMGYERYTTTRFSFGWNGAAKILEVDETVYAALSEFVLDKTGLTVNGTRLWEISATSISQDDLTLFFGSVSGSWQSSGFIGNLYYLSIEKDGKKVMDLIPVVDWDGVACWHDKVSGNNFYNNGTGAFSVGDRV